jgi:hypothetical protein
VRGLPRRRCYYADDKGENYLTIDAHPQLAAGQEYRVFFDVRPVAGPDAVLVYVQSAYPGRQGGGGVGGVRRKKVGFLVLVNHALQRTRPAPPP